MSAGEWQADALCARVDPELFFPTADGGPALDAQERAAKSVCAVCPVREACLEFALRSLPHGIAGGLTAAERAERRGDRVRPARRGAA